MALIKCKECGKMISDEAGACPQCGKPVELPSPAPAPAPKGSGKGLLVVILLLLAAGAGYWAYRQMESEKIERELKKVEKGLQKAMPGRPKETVLVDGEVAVDEDDFHPIRVELEARSKVTVIYTLSSGPAMDIFTLNSPEYEVWKNTKKKAAASISPVAALSESGKKRGTITAVLDPGTYYVIIDNTNYGACAPPTNTVNDRAVMRVKVTVKEE